MIHKGRIVDIDKHQNRAVFIKQGVPKSEQHKYENYSGGNGTYVTGSEYLGTSLIVKVSVYDNDNHVTKMDLYDEILQVTGKKRISSVMMEKIMSHVGDKVEFIEDDNGNWMFDVNQIL